jgi:hypothetical protein
MSTVVRIEAGVLLIGSPRFAIDSSCVPALSSFDIDIVAFGKILRGEDFFVAEEVDCAVTQLAESGISMQSPHGPVLVTESVFADESGDTRPGATGYSPQQLVDASSTET